MPPPTSLSIKTSSVTRLIKEESSYRREVAVQRDHLAVLEVDDIADEYALRQFRQALKQTEAMPPVVRKKLKVAVEALEMELAAGPASAEDVEKAEKAVRDGKEVIEEYGSGE